MAKKQQQQQIFNKLYTITQFLQLELKKLLPEEKRDIGRSPLFVACQCGCGKSTTPFEIACEDVVTFLGKHNLQNVQETICEFILKIGANANDLFYAIFRYDNFRIAKLLLDYAPNEKICEFLLKIGANANMQNDLFYAILRYDNFRIAKLLLDYYGENPHSIFEGGATPQRIADGYELFGARLLLFDENIDKETTFKFWRLAIQVRNEAAIFKQILHPPKKVYQFKREFITEDEFIDLTYDDLKIQSLLICERLSISQKELVLNLRRLGFLYLFKFHQIQKFIDFALYAVQIDNDLDYIERLIHFCHYRMFKHDFPVNFDDVFQTLLLLSKHIKRRTSVYTLIAFLTGIYILLNLSKTDEGSIFELTSDIVSRIDPRTLKRGNSLLHLSLSSVSVTSFLLNCGANINSTNDEGYSPLFLTLVRHEAEEGEELKVKHKDSALKMTKFLLESGAHIDQKTHSGERPSQYLDKNLFNVLDYTTLQCLAARVIQEYNIPGKIPMRLKPFIRMH